MVSDGADNLLQLDHHINITNMGSEGQLLSNFPLLLTRPLLLSYYTIITLTSQLPMLCVYHCYCCIIVHTFQSCMHVFIHLKDFSSLGQALRMGLPLNAKTDHFLLQFKNTTLYKSTKNGGSPFGASNLQSPTGKCCYTLIVLNHL